MGHKSRFHARVVAAILAAMLPICWCPLRDLLCALPPDVPARDHRIADSGQGQEHERGERCETGSGPGGHCPCDEKGTCGRNDLRGDGLQVASLSETDSAVDSGITCETLRIAGRTAGSALKVAAERQVPPATPLAQRCSLLI